MQSIGRKLRKALGVILDILFPPRCIGCDELLDYDSNDIFCAECRSKWEEYKHEKCKKCGQPIPECWCGVPENIAEMIDGEVHLVQYDKSDTIIKRLIFNCKQRTVKRNFEGIAVEFMNDLYPRLPNGNYVVTAVPRSKAAKRKYGHDQSVLAAIEFCKLAGLEYLPVLYHVGNKKQKTLTQKQREENAVHSYKIKNKITSLVKGKNVILIDDVVTTGSSVVRCAKLLKSKGAKRVYVMCIAKTV